MENKEGNVPARPKFDFGRYPFLFSPAAFFSLLVGENSFLRCLFVYPFRTFFLIIASAFPAIIITGAVYIAVILARDHARWVYDLAAPYLYGNNGYPAILLGTLVVTAYGKYERKWYPRRPTPGYDDMDTVVSSCIGAVRSICWHLIGFVVVLFMRAYEVLRPGR